uniref:IRG-type G domain-containing protein n=1 Tax=Varanus komodoensis TaxID=61221 RepID=A0A8D2J5J6_VARKO
MEKRLKYLKGSFEKASFPELSDSLEEVLYSLESAGLVVGIAGESGAGKSTFINSFRELREEDEGAAPTGRADTSRGPTPYPHPKYDNVILWDLPSIDSPEFQRKDYLEQISASRYDFVVVMACQHFTSLHARLALHIKNASKAFYFVRSKVDADLEARRSSNPLGFIDAVALQRIREESLHEHSNCSYPNVLVLFV